MFESTLELLRSYSVFNDRFKKTGVAGNGPGGNEIPDGTRNLQPFFFSKVHGKQRELFPIYVSTFSSAGRATDS